MASIYPILSHQELQYWECDMISLFSINVSVQNKEKQIQIQIAKQYLEGDIISPANTHVSADRGLATPKYASKEGEKCLRRSDKPKFYALQ